MTLPLFKLYAFMQLGCNNKNNINNNNNKIIFSMLGTHAKEHEYNIIKKQLPIWAPNVKEKLQNIENKMKEHVKLKKNG